MAYNPTQKRRIEKGLCVACGAKSRQGKMHCAECAEQKALKQKQYRDQRREDGLCHICGKRAATSFSRCEKCNGRDKAYAAERIKRFRASGKCRVCGGDPLPSLKDKRNLLCETHYLQKTARNRIGTGKAWKVLKEKLVSQDYKCSYTGTPLVLGENASVDHILPYHRYPHLKSDLDNIEWVTDEVNEMKRDRSPDEFIALITKILAYRSS